MNFTYKIKKFIQKIYVFFLIFHYSSKIDFFNNQKNEEEDQKINITLN